MAIRVPKGYLAGRRSLPDQARSAQAGPDAGDVGDAGQRGGRLHAEPGLRRPGGARPQPHAQRPDSRGGDLLGRGQRLHRRARPARRRGDGPAGRRRLRGRARPGPGALDRRDRRSSCRWTRSPRASRPPPSSWAGAKSSLISAARGMLTTDTVHKLAGRTVTHRRPRDPDHRHGQGGGHDGPEHGHHAGADHDRRRARRRPPPRPRSPRPPTTASTA